MFGSTGREGKSFVSMGGIAGGDAATCARISSEWTCVDST